MHAEIAEEYKPKLEAIGLDYDIEYLDAYARVGNNPDAIKSILQSILDAYSDTSYTTKVGRWMRFIAKILSKIKIKLK